MVYDFMFYVFQGFVIVCEDLSYVIILCLIKVLGLYGDFKLLC